MRLSRTLQYNYNDFNCWFSFTYFSNMTKIIKWESTLVHPTIIFSSQGMMGNLSLNRHFSGFLLHGLGVVIRDIIILIETVFQIVNYYSQVSIYDFLMFLYELISNVLLWPIYSILFILILGNESGSSRIIVLKLMYASLVLNSHTGQISISTIILVV